MRGIVKGGLNDKGGGGSFDDEYVNNLLHENVELTMIADTYDRVDVASDVYYDDFSGIATNIDYSAGHLDDTKTKAISDLLAGETDLSAKIDKTDSSIKWFNIGDEVTIQDDENKECVIVTNTEVINNEIVYDVSTPVNIVNSAYTTSASARPQRLSNGWIVNAYMAPTPNYPRFAISEDNGTTWQEIETNSGNVEHISLASANNFAYMFVSIGSSFNIPRIYTLDAINKTTTFYSFPAVSDIGQCSLCVNEAQTELHATWSAKTTSHPNSFNIFYCKGTINADGSVTWGSVEQLTTDNTSTTQNTAPVLIINKLGYSVVIYQLDYSSNKYICRRYFDGSQWTAGGNDTIYNGGSYAQSLPDADTLSDGTIIVSWHGKDNVDSVGDNIRFCMSIDNGITWSAMQKLTSGNYASMNPSITRDKNDNIYIIYRSADATVFNYANIRMLKYESSWVDMKITSNTTNSAMYPSVCNNYRNFFYPICIYQDLQASAVKFRGIWAEGENSVTLVTSALQNAYKKGAWIYRSLTTNGGFSEGFVGNVSIEIDRSTPVNIVNSAYTTSANSRPQRLSNGWLVVCVNDTTNKILRLYVSKNSGTTWQQLCYRSSSNIGFSNFSIISFGNYIYLIYTLSATYFGVYGLLINAETQTDSDITTPATTISDNATALGSGLNVFVNEAQTELHATWSAKTSSYPNSFNIVYCKGTIGGDGTVTWGGVEQVTKITNSSNSATSPCIIVKNDGYPLIIEDDYSAGANCIYALIFNGTDWNTTRLVYNGGSYTQASPSIDISPDGAIHIEWYGANGVDYNKYYSKSLDNGMTWLATPITIRTGTANNSNGVGCISCDKDSNVWIYWVAQIDSTIWKCLRVKYTKSASTWGATETIEDNVTTGSAALCNNYKNYTEPLAVYSSSSSTKFSGVWTEGVNSYAPLLSEDIRYNITPNPDTEEIVSWITKEKDLGFTIDSKISIVANDANESYGNPTVIVYDDTDLLTEEIQYVYSAPRGSKVTQKITLSRSAVDLDKKITKLLGAIGP